MDPTTWPLWVKLACGCGPLGIWAVRAEIARARSERDHHKTRDMHTKVIEALEERNRKVDEARDKAHQEQLREVTDRLIKIVEAQSRQAHRLADGVNDRIRRKRRHDDDEEEGGGGSGDS